MGATVPQPLLGTRTSPVPELADLPGAQESPTGLYSLPVESPRVRLAAGTLDAIRGAGLSGLRCCPPLFISFGFFCVAGRKICGTERMLQTLKSFL